MSTQEIFETEEATSVVLKDKPGTLSNTGILPVNFSNNVLRQPEHPVIQMKYYNAFNFTKLADAFGSDKITVGITSANRGEGKTLVAANMAVSLATGYQQKTLLIDMNLKNPNLHTVFGADQGPGLAEALHKKQLNVVATHYHNLYLMTAGDLRHFKPQIQHTLILRQILRSLKHEFDFVLIDMGSILPIEESPVHFINEIDGLLCVVNGDKTRSTELRKVFNNLDERQFLGYVFNKVGRS